MEKKIIDSFTDNYFFLSNFCPCRVDFGQFGMFHNSEAAYQAMKCPERSQEFQFLSPENAKWLGRRVGLPADWDERKDTVMLQVVRAKFLGNSYLAHWLLHTGDAILIEGNNWGDRYWGQVNGVGENRLGQILMQVREELRSVAPNHNR